MASSAFPLRLSAALVVALALPVPAAQAASLKQDLVRALKPVKRHAAVAIYDTRAKRTVFALRSGSKRPLGSNTKLFTATAALRALPPLTTQVVGDPAGDLFLVGGGDPALGRPQMEALAAQVHAAGVRTVAGGIVGDGSRFGPSPPFDPEIGGVLGALVYDRGRAVDGGPLQPDPALAAATRFDDALEALGITVAGGQRAGVAPAGAPVLATVSAPARAELARRMLVPSDNFVAEMLTLALGGPTEVAELAGPADLVDGSGLSPENRAAPKNVTALLADATPGFKRTLPVAGREGTVAGRMRGTRGRCRVKTGTIAGAKVSALSGYCGRYAFSVLIRGTRVARAERAGDAVAAALARAR